MAEKFCIEGCGRKTTEKSGVCALCKIDLDGKRERAREAGMEKSKRVTSKPRTCEKCGEEYIPRGNRQKFCEDCKTKTKKGGNNKALKNKTLGEFPMRPSGKIVESRETLQVIVDLSRYPKLHSRLLETAREEFREPGQQLLYMLHQEFEKREEALRD